MNTGPAAAGPGDGTVLDGDLLTTLVADALHFLAMRGSIDPWPGEWPDGLVEELTALAAGGRCGAFDRPPALGGSALADHWEARRQREYERSVPTWECDCGRVYKVLAAWREDQLWEAADDGLIGKLAGRVRRDGKGKVTRSGACPGCGHPFAGTMARQAEPQQPLFDDYELRRRP
jgi:hypothetical protein